MKTEHFPDLERCKKLTLLGFPETEKEYTRNIGGRYLGEDKDGKSIVEPFDFNIKRRTLDGEITTMQCTEHYVCPSVMELLNELPTNYIDKSVSSRTWNPEGIYGLNIYPRDNDKENRFFQVEYTFDGSGKYFRDTLPNALADMWIWAKENGHIS